MEKDDGLPPGTGKVVVRIDPAPKGSVEIPVDLNKPLEKQAEGLAVKLAGEGGQPLFEDRKVAVDMTPLSAQGVEIDGAVVCVGTRKNAYDLYMQMKPTKIPVVRSHCHKPEFK